MSSEQLEAAFSVSPMDVPTVLATKKRGRKPAKFWTSFTTSETPYKLRTALCRHCLVVVNYHKKWEQAKSHLMKCDPFLKSMQATSVSERPDWFMVELEKRRRSTSRLFPLDLLQSEQIGTTDRMSTGDTMAMAPAMQPTIMAPAPVPATASSAKAPSAGELLVLQAFHSGSVDNELLLYSARDSPMSQLMAQVHDRVHCAVDKLVQRLGAASVGGTLLVQWEPTQKKGILYWIAVGERCFFVGRSMEPIPDPATQAATIQWVQQDVDRIKQKFSGILDGHNPPSVVVDAPLDFVQHLAIPTPEPPSSSSISSQKYHASPRGAMIQLIQDIFQHQQANGFTGLLEFALTFHDKFTLLTSPPPQPSKADPSVNHDAFDFLPTTMFVVPGTTRWITLAQVFRGVLYSGKLTDVAAVRGSLKGHCLNEQSLDHLCGILTSEETHTKRTQFLSVVEPLVCALGILTKQTVRPSDVLVAYGSLQKSLEGAATTTAPLTNDQQTFLKATVLKYKDLFHYREARLMHLLDPVYLGEYLDNTLTVEQELLAFPSGMEDSDAAKQALFLEYTQFQVAAVEQRDNADDFVFRMLKDRKKTVLQYWLTDGRRWPKLQAVALQIERVAADGNGFCHGKMEGSRTVVLPGPFDEEQAFYVQMNAPLLSVADLGLSAGNSNTENGKDNSSIGSTIDHKVVVI